MYPYAYLTSGQLQSILETNFEQYNIRRDSPRETVSGLKKSVNDSQALVNGTQKDKRRLLIHHKISGTWATGRDVRDSWARSTEIDRYVSLPHF